MTRAPVRPLAVVREALAIRVGEAMAPALAAAVMEALRANGLMIVKAKPRPPRKPPATGVLL
jgi:hypothetical protein